MKKDYLLGRVSLHWMDGTTSQYEGDLYLRYLTPCMPVLMVSLVKPEADDTKYVAFKTRVSESRYGQNKSEYCIQVHGSLYFYWSESLVDGFDD